MTQNIPINRIEKNKGQIAGLPKNPRVIRNEKFEKLKRSIEENPEMLNLRELLVYPIGNKYVVIGGNMRLEACKALGYKEVPCKVLDASTTAEQMKAYTIKDNAGFGEWDTDLLANEWDVEQLAEWGVDIAEWNTDSKGKATQAKEDNFNEEDAVEARCHHGDIWQLGRHRLMCGDSTDDAQLVWLLNGDQADLSFTSPPYGVNIEYGEYVDTFENTKSLVEKALPLMASHTKDYCVLNWGDIVSAKEINHTEQPSMFSWLPVYLNIMQSVGFYLWAERIWKKPHARCSGIWSASSNRPVSDWEYVFSFAHGKPSYNERGGDSHFGVIDTSEDDQLDTLSKHPAAFPVMIPSRVILAHTKPDALVLDIFGGSGTTLIAAEELDRRCCIMELDPHYCDIILARWENLTGNKAERIFQI